MVLPLNIPAMTPSSDIDVESGSLPIGAP